MEHAILEEFYNTQEDGVMIISLDRFQEKFGKPFPKDIKLQGYAIAVFQNNVRIAVNDLQPVIPLKDGVGITPDIVNMTKQVDDDDENEIRQERIVRIYNTAITKRFDGKVAQISIPDDILPEIAKETRLRGCACDDIDNFFPLWEISRISDTTIVFTPKIAAAMKPTDVPTPPDFIIQIVNKLIIEYLWHDTAIISTNTMEKYLDNMYLRSDALPKRPCEYFQHIGPAYEAQGWNVSFKDDTYTFTKPSKKQRTE